MPPLVQRPSKNKTVRIASPPATTPISPQSFPSEPSSPIFARVEQSGSLLPHEREAKNLGKPPAEDPFSAEGSEEGEDDPVVGEEVLQNTRKNLAISASEPQSSPGDGTDAVSRTLARFAPRPPRAPGSTNETLAGTAESGQAKAKQPMDVDAFKRLLLTGNTVAAAQKLGASTSSNNAQHGPVSDSSSNTDTASVSRQSIFEPLPPLQTDTPRTSQELSPGDVEDEVRRLVSNEERKKPPPPKTRHGKLIKTNLPVTSAQADPASEIVTPRDEIPSPASSSSAVGADLNKPLPLPPSDTHPFGPADVSIEGQVALSHAHRRPPTPPMTRRKSQKSSSKPDLVRSPSSNQTFESPFEDAPIGSQVAKTPPAPPSRRGNRNSLAAALSQANLSGSSLGQASESESSLEKTAGADTQSVPSPPLAGNASISSTGSIKRLSRPPSSFGIPPPPPPRRGRGSSRSSVDAQRPVGLGSTDTTMTSGETGSASGENSHNVLGSTKSNDILADLAALQREVDSLRQKQGRE